MDQGGKFGCGQVSYGQVILKTLRTILRNYKGVALVDFLLSCTDITGEYYAALLARMQEAVK